MDIRTIKTFRIHKLHFPIENNYFNVQVLTSIDGGKTFYYAGEGRYIRTKKEAEQFITNYQKQNGDAFIYC